MSSILNFDSNKSNETFLSLYDSSVIGTVDYDVRKQTKIDLSFNHVCKPLTIQELIGLHSICELETAELLNIIAMYFQNPQLFEYLFTANRRNLVCVGGSTASIFDRLIAFHLCLKLNKRSTKYKFSIKTL